MLSIALELASPNLVVCRRVEQHGLEFCKNEADQS